MHNALREAQKAYPNCRIANCDCDEYENEWKKDCWCMGHWLQMDRWFGKDKWKHGDDNVIRDRGIKKGTSVADIFASLPPQSSDIREAV